MATTMGNKFRQIASSVRSSTTARLLREAATLFDYPPYNGATVTKADLTSAVETAIITATVPQIDVVHPCVVVNGANSHILDRPSLPMPLQIVGRNFGTLDDPLTTVLARTADGLTNVDLEVINVWPDGTGLNAETQGLDPAFLTTFAAGGNLYVTSHGKTSAPFAFTISA